MRLMSWIVNMLMKAKPDNQQLETHEHSHSLTRKTQLYKQGNYIFIIINFLYFFLHKKIRNFPSKKSLFQRAGRANWRPIKIS